MKELFEVPKLEVFEFEAVDVITTSTVLDEDELPDLPVQG